MQCKLGQFLSTFSEWGSDSTQFETSLDIGSHICPRIAMTDEGYDSRANRVTALARGITPVIPHRESSRQRGRFFRSVSTSSGPHRTGDR
jgi:hypothetical protein